jgi:pimeloyl-ACP methyl ester carboxylesterase
MGALKLVFNVAKDGERWKGTMDSPDQGATGVPCDKVTLEGTNVKFAIQQLGASFQGTLDAEAKTISGLFKQSGTSLSLTLKKLDQAPDYRRPQEPRKPWPYEAVEVSFENAAAKNRLTGTLTVPRGKGPHPAVLLISGSGQQDRDETLLGHKPFLVLADHLTRQGIAVLRVDDRGTGGSTGEVMKATSEDFAGDAAAGVEFLKGRAEVQKKKIGLVGHSEGGMIAPMVAARSGDVAFIVLLAGPGQTGEEILRFQVNHLTKEQGATEEQAKKKEEQYVRVFEMMRGEPDDAAARKKALAILGEDREAMAGIMGPFDTPQGMGQLLNAWMRWFLTYDPKPVLAKVRCPVLALNGALDRQIVSKPNLAGIEAALKESGHKDFTVRELPGLNHLFQTAKTGSGQEYAKIDETFAPAALKAVSDWITARTMAR